MYFSPCVLSVSIALILTVNVKYFALDKLIQTKKKLTLVRLTLRGPQSTLTSLTSFNSQVKDAPYIL